ncbi:CopG family transcriptional regulator [Pseudoduganella sp. UC29_106]|uniref:ribbon-helix-helix domain-containing protein n=1 Tax=Pseudoduganella sp. UC29_106 TaxID=3374553 RepID=UPI0037565977
MNKKNETSEKRPVGAPPKMDGGHRMNVYLDDATIEAAKRLGNGNISEGIRKAVAAYSEGGWLSAMV